MILSPFLAFMKFTWLNIIISIEGGKSIQDECEEYITKSGPLSDGEVFCSKSGDLNCKMIAHAVGPTWKGGKHNEEKYLVQCIETCLAVTEKNKFASIAIPALCTGIFHYPSEAATNVIVEIVKDYFRVHPSSCIQTVCLCDVVFDTVKLFKKAANMHFSKTASKGKFHVHVFIKSQYLQGQHIR